MACKWNSFSLFIVILRNWSNYCVFSWFSMFSYFKLLGIDRAYVFRALSTKYQWHDDSDLVINVIPLHENLENSEYITRFFKQKTKCMVWKKSFHGFFRYFDFLFFANVLLPVSILWSLIVSLTTRPNGHIATLQCFNI